MNKKLSEALNYQINHNFVKSNELLIELLDEQPTNAYIHYECARNYDHLSHTYAAIFHYEQAILLNIEENLYIPSIVKLCTYFRNLNEHQKALSLVAHAQKNYPKNYTLKIIHQLTLYYYYKQLKAEPINNESDCALSILH
jgi:tetratricopeptide (TPR) repeat protein